MVMNNRDFLRDSPIMGYAHHRIILDDAGKPFDYEFLEVNATFEKLTGLQSDKLIGRTVRQAIPGIEKGAFDWIAYYGEIALNGGEKEFEQYSEPLGKWYRVHVYSNEKLTFTTMFVDTTASKKQTEELEAFFSVNLDLLCIADMEGHFIKTNAAWSQVLGYATEELNKRKFLEFVHPDDMPATLDAMASLGKGDDVLQFANRYRRKDGSYRYIEWRSHRKGNLIYAAARDVTERIEQERMIKETHKMLQVVLDTIPQHVFWKDRNSVYLGCNKRGAVAAGLSDPAEIVGKTDYDLPRNREKADLFRADDQRVMQKNAPELHVIEQRLRADGKRAWLDTTKIPLRDDKGAVNGILVAFEDITAWKTAEEEKLLQAVLIKSLLASIPDIVYFKDCQGVYLGCNPLFAELVGKKSEEEVIGKTDYDLFNKEQADFFRHHDNEMLKQLKPLQNEEEVVFPDGRKMTIDTLKTPYRDQNGNVIGILGISRDITDRKRMEEELRASKERFELVVNGTNDGAWDWNILTNELFLSARWKEMLGYADCEIQNEFDSFISLLYEEDITGVNEYVQGYLNGEIKKYAIEFRMKHKNGSLVWILAKGEALRDGKGIPYRMAGSHSDITEQKKAEEALKKQTERLNAYVENAPYGILIANAQGKYVFVNRKACEQTGYNPEELLELGPMALTYPEDLGIARDYFRRVVADGSAQADARFVCKSGEARYWRVLAVKITDNEFAGFTEDITERKQAELDLKRAKEQAEAANKAKSQFLANMSHEIRTPLNGVIGFTDLLKGTPLSPVQQQYVHNANVSGHTLLGIINDILDFSKIEAGMLHLEMIKTDLIELLENSVDIVKFAAGKKGLELLLHIDPAMPRFAVTDPIRLKQILANLLGNAVKFTEKGEVELKVGYDPLDDVKGRISFFIRDTGIGISEEQKGKLFKAFSQADSSTTRKFGGTGLGLIISDLIAKEMGSKIQILSKQGEGTTFYFDIVTDTEEGEKLDKRSLEKIKRCLIIDDNANNRLILEEILANWGIAYRSCGDGLTALHLLETSAPFDIILCDYNMPDIDGLETIRLIREKLKLSPQKQPIILLHSSSDDEELHKKCEELGVRFRLTKPVKSGDLHAYLCQVHTPRQARKRSAVSTVFDAQAISLSKEYKILIAEDVGMNMMMIKALIGKIYPCAELIEAADGLQAVNQFSDTAPDLIFMDVQMPEMDGLEATRKIRALEKESGKHVPIVALTAGAFKEEHEKCLTAGMDDFLAKPVESGKIMDVIEKHLAPK